MPSAVYINDEVCAKLTCLARDWGMDLNPFLDLVLRAAINKLESEFGTIDPQRSSPSAWVDVDVEKWIDVYD